jgi:hypothetical protein
MWIAPELQPIIGRFPHAQNQIIQLFNNDLNFRSICEDYWVCMSMLEKTRSGASDSQPEFEYNSIRELLETELEEYLKRNQKM